MASNDITDDIKTASSIDTFKRKLMYFVTDDNDFGVNMCVYP